MPLRHWQQALWALYKVQVFEQPSIGTLFNMYRDETRGLDGKGAAEQRRNNLKAYLTAFPKLPRALVIGEAPGPWGCRFTGVPYTSECLYAEGALPFDGRKTSAQETPHGERTATIFWNVMTPHFPHFLIWNTLPYHPHRPGEPLSIRPPTVGEVRAHLSLMEEVLRLVQPEQILAVGRVAQGALTKLNRDFIPIRHPSHGGAAEFRRGIADRLNFKNGTS